MRYADVIVGDCVDHGPQEAKTPVWKERTVSAHCKRVVADQHPSLSSGALDEMKAVIGTTVEP